MSSSNNNNHNNNNNNNNNNNGNNNNRNKNNSVLAATTVKKQRTSGSVRAGLNFPVGRVNRMIRESRYDVRVKKETPVYMAAVLEYLSSEILEIAGRETVDANRKVIAPYDLLAGIQGDRELSTLLGNAGCIHIAGAGWVTPPQSVLAESGSPVQSNGSRSIGHSTGKSTTAD
ncbi:histone-fold-containing protein [Halteromyces radiatus]|uniref:histone-fold-containing protein n=1 Tax=Halteromyces radiatus TaxID=101107 RepID=UPI00221FDA52|nr:histone-fold-containing protein [Halteromyces radiatus]KAI8092867.1 histone-fold-containing protein [Halteromyces radiatus]